MKITKARLKEIILEVLRSGTTYSRGKPVRLRGWGGPYLRGWGEEEPAEGPIVRNARGERMFQPYQIEPEPVRDRPAPVNPFTVPPPKGQISLDIDPIKKGDFVVLNDHAFKDPGPKLYKHRLRRYRGVEGRVLTVKNMLTKADPDWRVQVEFFFKSPTADEFIVKTLWLRRHQVDRVKPKQTASMDTLPIWRPEKQ